MFWLVVEKFQLKTFVVFLNLLGKIKHSIFCTVLLIIIIIYILYLELLNCLPRNKALCNSFRWHLSLTIPQRQLTQVQKSPKPLPRTTVHWPFQKLFLYFIIWCKTSCSPHTKHLYPDSSCCWRQSSLWSKLLLTTSTFILNYLKIDQLWSEPSDGISLSLSLTFCLCFALLCFVLFFGPFAVKKIQSFVKYNKSLTH